MAKKSDCSSQSKVKFAEPSESAHYLKARLNQNIVIDYILKIILRTD